MAAIAEKRTSEPRDRWLWPAIMLLILVAPSQFSYALDPKHGPFILYADVLAAVVFAAWAVALLLQGRLRDLILPPVALWALLVVAGLSALGAASARSAAVEIAQLALYFVAIFAMFAEVLRDRNRIGMAVKTLALATTIAVLWGLYHYLTQDDPAQVRGPFGNRNVYSGYLAMVLPLLFGLGLWIEQANQRAWFYGLVAVGAFTMLAGPQFWCLALVLLAMAAIKSWRTAGYFLVIAAAFLGLMLALAPRNYKCVVRELLDPIERGEVYKTVPDEPPVTLVRKRWLEWQPALSMLGGNLALGVGVGNYQDNIGQYYGFLPNAKKTEPDTNNLYLVTGASMGFMGLVCLVAFLGHFVSAARELWLKVNDSWGQGLAAGLAGSMYAVVLVNLFSSLFVRGNSLVWALLLAMIASVAARAAASGPGSEETDR